MVIISKGRYGMTKMPLRGRCLCGKIAFELTSPPFDGDYCHCLDCQKSSGALVMAWCDIRRIDLQWTGHPPKEYTSSEKIRRGFCEDCGCSMTYRHIDIPDILTLSTACFDEKEELKPFYHIYTRSQPAWFQIQDELPRYPAEKRQ